MDKARCNRIMQASGELQIECPWEGLNCIIAPSAFYRFLEVIWASSALHLSRRRNQADSSASYRSLLHSFDARHHRAHLLFQVLNLLPLKCDLSILVL